MSRGLMGELELCLCLGRKQFMVTGQETIHGHRVTKVLFPPGMET